MSLPTPNTRKEQYLNAIATGNFGGLPTPITREEEYLDAIAKSGGGGSGEGDMKKSVYDSDLAVANAGGIGAFVSDAISDSEKDIYAIMGEMGAKNLIPYPWYGPSNNTSGLTFTDNDDGTTTINGTATANGVDYVFLSRLSNKRLLKGNQSYILSIEIVDGSITSGNTTFYFKQYAQPSGGGAITFVEREISSNNPVRVYSDTFTPTKAQIESSPVSGCYLNIPRNTVLDNLKIRTMLRLASDTDDTYQPYAKTNKQLTDEIANNTEAIADNTAAIEATQSMIVDEYNEGNFVSGDYCKYQNKLYRCISPTSGTWDSSKWTEVTTMSEVERLTIGTTTQLRSGFHLQKQGNTKMLFFNGVARVGTTDTDFDDISQTGEKPQNYPIFGAGILVMDNNNNFPCTLVLNTNGKIEVYYKDGTGECKAPVNKLVYGILTWII